MAHIFKYLIIPNTDFGQMNISRTQLIPGSVCEIEREKEKIELIFSQEIVDKMFHISVLLEAT